MVAAVLSLNLLFPVLSNAQNGQYKVTVTDESGTPVPGASVIIGEGMRAVFTNENGEFVMPADSVVPVFVEADGFESKLIRSSESLGLKNITLERVPVQMGEKNKVFMPFGIFARRQLAGDVTVLLPGDILKYDQTDVPGALNGRVPGMFSPSNIRGMDAPLMVIDGIPRPASDINIQQVEQITVVKDLLSSMLYGSQGSNGVILITTRRGEPLKKTLRFTAENGFNKPVSYPKYLNAAGYMELYNEALANDGLAPKFSNDEIANTRNGGDPVRYPDENYYNSTYLKDWSTYQNVVGEASGGNEIAQYYLNLGWHRSNGLLNVGEGANEKEDRLNMRGNIDYNIGKAIHLKFDGAVIFDIANGPRYSGDDFWALSTRLHPEYYPVLVPVNLIKDPTLLGSAKLVDDKYVLGGTSEYLTNVYGELTRNGARQVNGRQLEMSTGLDFDLSSLTKGLSASVYFSFDIFSQYSADLLNGYAVYDPVFTNDSVMISKYGVDLRVDQQTITNSTYYRRIGMFGTLDYSRRFGDHEIKATAVTFRDQYSVESIQQPAKHLQLGTRINYIFRNKFIAELTGVMAGSTKLFETDPYAFSPGAGIAWILSEEDFLKDNSVINYLKFRTNWAINHTDEALQTYYTGRSLYTNGSTFYYDQGIYGNSTKYISNGNPNLGWSTNMNINVGFESLIFNNKVGIDGTYFFTKSSDLITTLPNSLPPYYVGLPFQNYGSNQTRGVEAGLNYRIVAGNLEITLGGNVVYADSKVLSTDEPKYPDAYRSRTGKPTDAIFGFVALGLFADQTEIDNSPLQTFGNIQPGDIRYKDLNGDNIIDNNDQMMIGNSGPRTGYGLTLNIRYNALELFALATGQAGANRIFNDPYYWVYGDRKYSEVVLNRWTHETATTASYPRLTSTSDNNNFMNSTYWLNDNNWLNMQVVQLTYTLTNVGFAGLNDVRFFIRGNNVARLSKIKKKTELNIGTAPQMRSLSLGLAMQF